MRRYEHLSDLEVVGGLDELSIRDRGTSADFVAHIAEIDARELYRAAGYDSTYAYCLGRLHLSEDSAYKRIQAARVTAAYPRLLDDIEAGRLNLSSLCLLAQARRSSTRCSSR